MTVVALAYVRRSVVKVGKPTLSPQRQQDTIDEYCQAQGWAPEYYVDAEGHRSGRTEKGRTDWLRLKARVEASQPGEIKAVVVYVLDRAARSTRDFLNFLHLLQGKQIDFVSVTQPYLDTTSAVGRAFMSMLSIWAQLEADIDSERVSADIAYRQEQGLHVGHCPIGYTRQVVNGERIPVPDETAPQVVQIWEAYATGKHSYRSLARWINNELALRTAGGDLWTHKHVQVMFENWEFYSGWVTRHRKRGGKERYRGKHEPIIGNELAASVLATRENLRDERLQQRPEGKHIYLLTPMLYCTCGAQLRGRNSHQVPHYDHLGTKRCGYTIVDADLLERQVLAYFDGWTVPADLEAMVGRFRREQEAQRMMTEDQTSQVRKLEHRKERAMRLFELGLRDEGWLTATVKELDASIETLRPQVQMPYDPATLALVIKQFGLVIRDPSTPRGVLKELLYTIVDRIQTNGEVVTKLTPRQWFLDFFQDCAAISGDMWYPQGERR